MFVTRFFLGLVLYSNLFPYFYCFFFFLFFFFFCGKDDVLFPNAVERNFQSFNLSSAVQYYSYRVSMTLKRQSVQSLSGHKAARTLCVSQEGGIVEVMVWSKTKWSFPLVWIGAEGARWGRGEVSETGERIEK